MKVLLLNQCFYPDVVATAQYLTDLALELRNAGHDVTVVAAAVAAGVTIGIVNAENAKPASPSAR
jgi:uncharacterized metal-binding protein